MMLVSIVFSSCLLCLLSPSFINAAVPRPSLGPVYAVATNISALNFTFVYPTNFQFDRLFVNFTLYDFIGNKKLEPQIYPSYQANFTNSNTSLPWVIPAVVLVPGDYVIACFQWVQVDKTSQTIDDSRECMLTRASFNSTLPSVAGVYIDTAMVTNHTIIVNAYFPQALPYDVINITANLNGAMAPSMMNTNMNDTYATIKTFSFPGLVANTYYNVCVLTEYQNSKIVGTYRLDARCQSITTVGAYGSQAMISSVLIIVSILFGAFI